MKTKNKEEEFDDVVDSGFAIQFLNNEFAKEEKDRQEMYLRNGIKKYKYRTREEKIRYCGRVMGKARDAYFGGLRPIREWRCGIVRPGDGDDEQEICHDCANYVKRKKYRMALDRIDFAIESGDTIFFGIVHDKDEMRTVQRRAKSSGYEYLSLPTEVDDVRVVFVNGPVVENLEIIDRDEIKRKLSQVTRKINNGNLSGKLGIEVTNTENADFVICKSYGVYDIDDEQEGKFDAVSIALTSDVEITRETFQDIYDLRQKIFMELVKGIDPNAVLIETGPSPVDFEFAKKSFAKMTVQESGRLDMLDPETRNALTEMKNGVLEKIEEYKGVH